MLLWMAVLSKRVSYYKLKHENIKIIKDPGNEDTNQDTGSLLSQLHRETYETTAEKKGHLFIQDSSCGPKDVP